MTADRIGFAIRSDGVSAVGLHDDTIVWAVRASLGSGDSLEEVACDLLRQAPRGRWRQSRVVAALGPTRSQTRQLNGLPPLEHARIASAIVKENVGRFFLRNGVPLVAGSAVLVADDMWWGAVFEEPVVIALRSACHRCRLKLVAVVPTISVLHAALDSESIVWRDGGMVIRARFDGPRLVESHRVPVDIDHSDPPLRGALASLGSDAVTFADAFSAATVELGRVPALIADDAAKETVPRWRLASAVSALGVAASLAVVAPGAAARYAADRADESTKRLEISARQALSDEATLGRRRNSLIEFSELMATTRHPASRVLSGLTHALPDSAAIVSVRLDSASGQVVVLAPRAATVLARLEGMRAVTNPLVVGAITRERVDGSERERVTIRFERP